MLIGKEGQHERASGRQKGVGSPKAGKGQEKPRKRFLNGFTRRLEV